MRDPGITTPIRIDVNPCQKIRVAEDHLRWYFVLDVTGIRALACGV